MVIWNSSIKTTSYPLLLSIFWINAASMQILLLSAKNILGCRTLRTLYDIFNFLRSVLAFVELLSGLLIVWLPKPLSWCLLFLSFCLKNSRICSISQLVIATLLAFLSIIFCFICSLQVFFILQLYYLQSSLKCWALQQSREY